MVRLKENFFPILKTATSSGIPKLDLQTDLHLQTKYRLDTLDYREISNGMKKLEVIEGWEYNKSRSSQVQKQSDDYEELPEYPNTLALHYESFPNKAVSQETTANPKYTSLGGQSDIYQEISIRSVQLQTPSGILCATKFLFHEEIEP